MTEYKSQAYDDDDMRDVISRIEEIDTEAKSVMGAALKAVGDLRKKQKNIRKEAKDDLGIPMGVLVPLLKRRALERKMKAIEEGVAEDLIEVFQDAAGQFSFLSPAGEEVTKPKKAKKVKADDKPWPDDAAKATAAAEQTEGEAILAKAGKPHDAVGFTDGR